MRHYSSRRRALLEHRASAEAVALLLVLTAAAAGVYLLDPSSPLKWQALADLIVRIPGTLQPITPSCVRRLCRW